MSQNSNINESIDSDVLIDKIAEKLDSVTRLNPEPLTFSNLPNEILGEIVGKLDLVGRLRTRKVSRNLRSVVDKQKVFYHSLDIATMKNRIYIIFGEKRIIYQNDENGCLIFYNDSWDSPMKEKLIQGNFLEIALNDLSIALKKPKFQLENFEFAFECNADAENTRILNFFKSLKLPIHAKSLKIYDAGRCDTLSILSLMKSGTLEKIELDGINIGLNMNELIKMDQWKKAKEVRFGDIPVRFEDFLHFKSFDIHVDSISLQDILRLRNVLSKSTNFKKCRLEIFNNRNFINLDEIGIALGSRIVRAPGPKIKHRYPIPGTNEFLDFEICYFVLFIDRTR